MSEGKQGLFQRDFILVVIGQVVSLFGNAMLRFALPLYLLRETGSSALFGAVNASSFIPMIVFSLFGGVLADRLNKRNIMVFLDFGTAALILGFYVLNGSVPLVPLMIICLMALYGISGAYQPAVQASIPVLVSSERITQGNAAINMVGTLSGLLGPTVGGVLFGAFGIVPILQISAACFVLSAIMEIFIHIPSQPRQGVSGVLASVRGDLGESMRYIRQKKPVFLSVVAVLALFNMVLSAAMIVGIPIMVVSFLGMSDARLGLTQGALGLGGLVGGVLAGVLGGRLRLRQGHWILLSCSAAAAVMGAALLPGVSAQAGYWLITGVSFAAMAGSTMFTIQICAAVQRQTPPHLIGKIMAFILAAANCASPLGQALYGVLFDAGAGLPWLVLFGSAAVALMVALYSKRVFWRLDQENEPCS